MLIDSATPFFLFFFFYIYMFKVEIQLTLQKLKKIKVQGPMIGSNKSTFLSDNCQVLLEWPSILSDRSNGDNCQ